MKLFPHHNHEGFTLIETLFAVLIFSASLVSLMSIAGRGIAAAQTAQEQTVAHYLAQEGIEVVRNIRDSNFLVGGWDLPFATCTETDPCQIDYQGGTAVPVLIPCPDADGCMIYSDFDAYSNSLTNPSGYMRSIYVIPAQSVTTGAIEEYQVVSKIAWKSKGVNRLVTMQTLLKKWQ